jgi:type II secretory pathway pseudopilin PulG
MLREALYAVGILGGVAVLNVVMMTLDRRLKRASDQTACIHNARTQVARSSSLDDPPRPSASPRD